MVYRLGKRVRPGFRAAKKVSLGLLGSLLVGTLAAAYANSPGNYPTTPGKHPATGNTSQTSKLPEASGSAHQITVAQTIQSPSASAGLRTAPCVLFQPESPGLAATGSPELRKLAQ